MEPEAELYVRMQILKSLDECMGYPMKENILFTQLNISLESIATTEEVAEHLEYLRSQGFVKFHIPVTGGPKQWSITPQGRDAFRDWRYSQ